MMNIANNPVMAANKPIVAASNAANIATKGASVASSKAVGAISPVNVPTKGDIADATCAGNTVRACIAGTNICIAIEKISDIGAKTTITAISPAIVAVKISAAAITAIKTPVSGRSEAASNSRFGTNPMRIGDNAAKACVITIVAAVIIRIDEGNTANNPDIIANIAFANISTTVRAVIVAVNTSAAAIRSVNVRANGVSVAANINAGATSAMNIPAKGARAAAVSIPVCDNIINSIFNIIS